jgi:hypothetical protein
MTDVAGTTIDLTGGTSGMGLMAGTMLAGLGTHLAIFARHPIEGPTFAAVDGRRVLIGKGGAGPGRHVSSCGHTRVYPRKVAQGQGSIPHLTRKGSTPWMRI